MVDVVLNRWFLVLSILGLWVLEFPSYFGFGTLNSSFQKSTPFDKTNDACFGVWNLSFGISPVFYHSCFVSGPMHGWFQKNTPFHKTNEIRRMVPVLELGFWPLELVSDFEIRISDFVQCAGS